MWLVDQILRKPLGCEVYFSTRPHNIWHRNICSILQSHDLWYTAELLPMVVLWAFLWSFCELFCWVIRNTEEFQKRYLRTTFVIDSGIGTYPTDRQTDRTTERRYLPERSTYLPHLIDSGIGAKWRESLPTYHICYRQRNRYLPERFMVHGRQLFCGRFVSFFVGSFGTQKNSRNTTYEPHLLYTAESVPTRQTDRTTKRQNEGTYLNDLPTYHIW